MSDAFPLGKPINRTPPPGLQPIAGRPGWWRHPFTGAEQYIEPSKPAPVYQAPLPPIEYDDDDTIHPYCGDEE